jgi:hypothetical protein
MSTPVRVALTLLVFFGSYVLGWLVLMLFLPLGGVAWLGNLLALIAAVFVARAAWFRAASAAPSALGYAGYGAAVLGSIGFAAGFFGPMIFAPQANQGPLLGIFITGPLGALLGAVLGLVYGATQARR